MNPARDELLELGTRRLLFAHIREHPGVHLRQLERDLRLALSTLEYHLHQMERGGILASRSDGKLKGYFVNEGMDRRDKDVLYLIRQKMPRRVVTLILMQPGTTPSELADRLNVAASTLSSHLKRLLRHEVVRVERYGRTKNLFVVEEARVSRLLVTYRKSFLDSIVDRFVETFEPLQVASARAPGDGGGGAVTDGGAPEDAPSVEADPGEEVRRTEPRTGLRGLFESTRRHPLWRHLAERLRSPLPRAA